MSIFEQATRANLRFPSARGMLSTEDLWELQLTQPQGFDLDNVAKAVNAELKAATEESFVETKANPAKARLELALEVVKHIIAVRIKEREDRKNRDARLEERRKLLAVLESKQVESLQGKTAEEILARLAELDREGT